MPISNESYNGGNSKEQGKNLRLLPIWGRYGGLAPFGGRGQEGFWGLVSKGWWACFPINFLLLYKSENLQKQVV
jgi:hypothetical protein